MDKIVHVEVILPNKHINKRLHVRERIFKDPDELNKYYKQAKKGSDVYINVRFYDAKKNPQWATKCDHLIQMTHRKDVFSIRSKDESYQ